MAFFSSFENVSLPLIMASASAAMPRRTAVNVSPIEIGGEYPEYCISLQRLNLPPVFFFRSRCSTRRIRFVSFTSMKYNVKEDARNESIAGRDRRQLLSARRCL